MKQVLVIAGSYSEFIRMPIGHMRESKYLGTLPGDIRGRADTALYLVGTYYTRKDFVDNEFEIREYCHTHNIVVSCPAQDNYE